METKRELKIDYRGLICASCKHPIIWQVADREGKKHEVLEAILKDYRGDGRIAALSFKYQAHGYRLPANSDKVTELLKNYPGFRNATHGFNLTMQL